ncbi:MAG: efflux RND transporter periplasmic adaptor subunit [Gammaproteobacteria bacterium]|nr:efflux RND transporter periplasmic adaptor subunit [Gammaproteobacteria bacterium]
MNNIFPKLLVIGVGVLALTGLGIFIGMSLSSHSPDDMMPTSAANSGAGEVLYWYDPMFPQQRFDQPGKSPFMDMELVPRFANGGGSGTVLNIDPGAIQNLGMRTAPVTRGRLQRNAELSGVVVLNERLRNLVQTRATAFVERVWPLAAGDLVQAGAPLVELLVPDWVAAQHELLALQSSGQDALASAARERLLLLGMPAALLQEVERGNAVQNRYIVTAPITGVLQSVDVRPGMTLSAGQTLVIINGLETVWLDVAVPESLADSIRAEDRLIVEFAAYPGRNRQAQVSEVLPTLNAASRTLRARLELDNADGTLRPGLSARVLLAGQTEEDVLLVPTEAVLHTGRMTLVMVAEDEGHFRPQEVHIGGENGQQTIIVDGLREGEQVVVSGQFLLDSEAQLRGILPVAANGAMAPAAPASTTLSTAAAATGSTPAATTMADVVLHEADGRIEAIADGQVRLSHGDFPTLPMPGMTMSFTLANESVIAGFAVGDAVRIALRASDNGLVVERLTPLQTDNAPGVTP